MDLHSAEKLRVADAMDVNPCTVSQDCTIEEALQQLLQKRLESCVVIEAEGRVRGCLDLRDLCAAQRDVPQRIKVGELLSREPLVLNPGAELLPSLELMKKSGERVASVMDGSKLLGELRLSTLGKRLPELLEHKEKELAALRAECARKDEYLGLVSHDMRAPLTVIALSTDYLLSTESVRTLNQDQKSFVERIKRNGKMASSMIHDILDVVRLEHGFRLDYQKVRFADLLAECIENLQVLTSKKKLSFEVTHDQDIQVNLDPNRMRQVIENLLINAIKFSPQGGQIFMHCWLAQKEGSPHLAFRVSDQGQGIRKEDEAKVFEAFVQADRAANSKEGLGLGLSIVRKFVEFHQGSLEIDGGWQKGASLTVYLPHATLLDTAPQVQTMPLGPVILLVEDDESIREFYKQSLEEFKYHVLEAGNGADAFTLFQKHAVDLVLSDIRMPQVDGLELLARIRALGSKVPVILCSGYYVGLENDLTRSDHKPNRIIDKPFKVKDMVAAIEDQLRRFKQAS